MNRLFRVTSTVSDGNMAYVWGEKKEVLKNRIKFLKNNDLKIEDCVFSHLTHGTDIEIVGEKDKGRMVEADALITSEKNVALWISTGDCLPVVFFDNQKRILGLVHLGWKGVDKKLAGKVAKKFIDLGSDSKNITIWIGPGVRKESYWKYDRGVKDFLDQIDVEGWKEFMEQKPNNELALDLVGYVKRQLTKNGIHERNIEVSPVDTVLDKNYFSQFRSDKKNQPQGRFATVAIIRPH